MTWEEARAKDPNHQWLLFDAVQAHSEKDKRIVEQLEVIGTFLDSTLALKAYNKLHREAPDREMYVFHTSRELLEIGERHWIGVRGMS
jgi:hypothetical protein